MSSKHDENETLSACIDWKTGEALVAAELLRRGVHVAYPAYDDGVDLLAYHEQNFNRVVPIQVKARSHTCYNFQKSWFRIDGLVLVQVWHTFTQPECYIFSEFPTHVEEALGPHCGTDSWRVNGGFTVTNPSSDDIERMKPHRDKWERILEQL